jgi:hypothetical protein
MAACSIAATSCCACSTIASAFSMSPAALQRGGGLARLALALRDLGAHPLLLGPALGRGLGLGFAALALDLIGVAHQLALHRPLGLVQRGDRRPVLVVDALDDLVERVGERAPLLVDAVAQRL